MSKIHQAHILILATHGFEQSELEYPRDELVKAGAIVRLASPDGQPIKGWKHTDWGSVVSADLRIGDVEPDAFDALVLPGGQMNPDHLRTDDDAMRVVRAFLAAGKVVAAICHAPWLLVEADAVRDRTVTSFKSIKTDVINAGGNWVDDEVACDRGIITSRSPDDLPAFVAKIVEEIREGRHSRSAATGRDGQVW